MNILLNNYCNLNCEYCFANKVIAEQKQEMTLENFKWLLNFLIKSEQSQVRLIGGEPTSHPQFKEFVLEALRRPQINSMLVFTNGTFDDRIAYLLYLASFEKEVALLINYNHPNIIGEEKDAIIERNIRKLYPRVKITLGINFYKPNQDYSYIIDKARKYDIKQIRYSIVVPNTEERKRINVYDYFIDFIPTIKQFIMDCVKLGITPHVDCNNIPLCMLDDETLRLFAMVSKDSLKTSICEPVIDVQPTMKAIRCFIMSDYKVNIKDFNTLQELERHFFETVDSKHFNVPIFDECKNCASFQLNINHVLV